MPHSFSLAVSMNLEHSIKEESHERYPVHLQCLGNIKKIKYLDFQAMTPIYDLQKKSKKFKWTEKAEKAFNDIKELLIIPPVLKAPTPDGLFCLESGTSQEGVGGTLLQKQRDEWVMIGYHSKSLP